MEATHVRMLTTDSETEDVVPVKANSTPKAKAWRRSGSTERETPGKHGETADIRRPGTPMVGILIEDHDDTSWGSSLGTEPGLSDTPSRQFSFSSSDYSGPDMEGIGVKIVTDDDSQSPVWGAETGLTRYPGRPVLRRQTATMESRQSGALQKDLLQNSGGSFSTIRARLSRRRLEEEEREKVMKDQETLEILQMQMRRATFRERLARRREERRKEREHSGQVDVNDGQLNLDDLPSEDWSGVSSDSAASLPTRENGYPILLEDAAWFEPDEGSEGMPAEKGSESDLMTEESVDITLPTFLLEKDAQHESTESEAPTSVDLSDPEMPLHSTRTEYKFRLPSDVLRKFDQSFENQ